MAIGMQQTQGAVRPPLASSDREDDNYEVDDWDTIDEDDSSLGYDDPVEVGTVPLNPLVVKLPLGALGRIFSVLTQYEGFLFTEQELNDLAELWAACGVRMSPVVQATVATSALLATKAGGYAAWVRAGRPNTESDGTGTSRRTA